MWSPLREINQKIPLQNQIEEGLIPTIGADRCDYTIKTKKCY